MTTPVHIWLALSKYHQVINPWQTAKEIQRAAKFIEAMLKSKSDVECRQLLRLDAPPRFWGAHGDSNPPETFLCVDQPEHAPYYVADHWYSVKIERKP